jgi:hypothetical protein
VITQQYMKTRPPPRGAAHPIDAVWRARVDERLAELGMNRSDLARKIGASTAAVAILMGPRTKQSRLVPAIHRVLGWRLPSPSPESDVQSDDLRRWEKLYYELDETGRNLVMALADKIVKKDG